MSVHKNIKPPKEQNHRTCNLVQLKN